MKTLIKIEKPNTDRSRTDNTPLITTKKPENMAALKIELSCVAGVVIEIKIQGIIIIAKVSPSESIHQHLMKVNETTRADNSLSRLGTR
jgi:hypothetical protein